MNIRFKTLGLLATALLAINQVAATSSEAPPAPTEELYAAMEANNIPAVTVFLRAGGDANSLFRPGAYTRWTLLHFAAHYGATEMVELLCHHGANLEAVTPRGSTPLILAIDKTTNGNALALIAHHVATGVGVNQCRWNGETAFLLAIKCGRDDVVKKLAEAGADTKAKDKADNNALHRAIQANMPYVIEWLLTELPPDQRPDPTQNNEKGESAVTLAQSLRMPANVVALLTQASRRGPPRPEAPHLREAEERRHLQRADAHRADSQPASASHRPPHSEAPVEDSIESSEDGSDDGEPPATYCPCWLL